MKKSRYLGVGGGWGIRIPPCALEEEEEEEEEEAL